MTTSRPDRRQTKRNFSFRFGTLVAIISAIMMLLGVSLSGANFWSTSTLVASGDVTAAGGRRADRWGADLANWDWYALDRTPASSRPRVEYVDGALRVRYGALAAGRHTLRVPLSEVAQGSFHVGAAWMEADGGRVWSVAPAAER